MAGDESRARFIAADKSGCTYAVGQFHGTVSIDGRTLTSRGDSDLFILALKKDGAVSFATSLGGAATDVPTAITVTPEGALFVAARSVLETFLPDGEVLTTSTASVTKFGSKGDVKWSRELEDTNATVTSMMTEHGNTELWMCGFGSAGVFISAWNKKANEVFRNDTVVPSGVSFTLATLDAEHNAVLSGTWIGSPMLGDFAFWFYYPRPTHFVAKLGVDGRWLGIGGGFWVYQTPYRSYTDLNTAPAAIAVSATDDIYTTGQASLPFPDLFLMRHRVDGSWGEIIYTTDGYRSYWRGTGLALDKNGDPYTCGYGIGYSLDPNKRWTALVLGPGFRYEIKNASRNDVITAQGICLDGKTRVYVTGHLSGKATFGNEVVGDVAGSPFHAFVTCLDDAMFQ